MGRPTDYTIELAASICERLGNGESLRTIGLDEAMPGQSTIYRWLAAYAEFREMYARARETQADTLADEILDIADNSSNDWMEKFDEQGANIGWRENGDAMRRSQLRIDTRKWLAAKLKPRKYGDKLGIGGADDLPAIQSVNSDMETLVRKLAAATGADEDAALRMLAAQGVEMQGARLQ